MKEPAFTLQQASLPRSQVNVTVTMLGNKVYQEIRVVSKVDLWDIIEPIVSAEASVPLEVVAVLPLQAVLLLALENLHPLLA